MSTAGAHLCGIDFKLLSSGSYESKNEVKSGPAYVRGSESTFL